MHHADIDLGLASLGTNRAREFFVMDFPAVRLMTLNAHALNMILAYVVVYVYILTMRSL